MRLQDFEVITFDCYGTLVDWESGIAGALQPLMEARGRATDREELLALYARTEESIEAGDYRRYRDVLGEATARIAAALDVELQDGDREVLADSLARWPLFDDTAAALARLAERFRLGILSNVDDDLFAATRERLGVDFEPVVTAQQVGSYKPNPDNFRLLSERVGVPQARHLHAAQSLFHDVVPARAQGLATVWVNRRGGVPGGATPPAEATPDLEVPDLRTLADLAEAG